MPKVKEKLVRIDISLLKPRSVRSFKLVSTILALMIVTGTLLLYSNLLLEASWQRDLKIQCLGARCLGDHHQGKRE